MNTMKMNALENHRQPETLFLEPFAKDSGLLFKLQNMLLSKMDWLLRLLSALGLNMTSVTGLYFC